MAILLITHDLGVVAEMADVVAVMYAGKIVDAALVGPMFDFPEHPYTKGLFASLPRLEGPRERLDAIAGRVPSLLEMPDGCRFHTRCPLAMERCQSDLPPFFPTSSGHASACWLHEADTVSQPEGG